MRTPSMTSMIGQKIRPGTSLLNFSAPLDPRVGQAPPGDTGGWDGRAGRCPSSGLECCSGLRGVEATPRWGWPFRCCRQYAGKKEGPSEVVNDGPRYLPDAPSLLA